MPSVVRVVTAVEVTVWTKVDGTGGCEVDIAVGPGDGGAGSCEVNRMAATTPAPASTTTAATNAVTSGRRRAVVFGSGGPLPGTRTVPPAANPAAE
ncbi:MAG TPA: hypothetical protein VIJ23_02000 [Mycobacterium sp.]